jgi:hypothetical protein
MFRELTIDEINKYASRKGVKRIAVENFLGSLGLAGSMRGELINMQSDAVLYGWNSATQNAITAGIKKAYKSTKKN